ncbi:MAG TPA: chemotaxis protein CheW [Nitrospirota bacterium]|nr:chemotaxis protein CheW [Nitrospirota bacterium]
MSLAELDETTQYLTFKLQDEVFAFDISKVREVLDFTTITKVPRTPEFMRGVINLRGSVVPVVDLRLKFGMAKTERTVNTCIIIMEVSVDGETTVLGALADFVQEVLDLASGNIEPAPRIGTKLKTEFIKGIGKQNDHFVIMLDVDKIFSTEELAIVQDTDSEVTGKRPASGRGSATIVEKEVCGSSVNAHT